MPTLFISMIMRFITRLFRKYRGKTINYAKYDVLMNEADSRKNRSEGGETEVSRLNSTTEATYYFR